MNTHCVLSSIQEYIKHYRCVPPNATIRPSIPEAIQCNFTKVLAYEV